LGVFVLLAYVDESYRDIKLKFLMAAVICSEHEAMTLTNELDAIVSAFVRNRGMSRYTELHAHDIWHHTGRWECLKDEPAAKMQLMTDCVDAIVRNASHVVWRAIDVVAHENVGYPKTWPPDVVGFQHLLERIERYAKSRNALALVIRDEVDDPNAPRKMLRDYRGSGTPGYIKSPLPHIVDTIHFAPSDHSRLLQAADMIAYVAGLNLHHSDLHVRIQPLVAALYAKFSSANVSWYSGIWP
jgi:hypothetical protein